MAPRVAYDVALMGKKTTSGLVCAACGQDSVIQIELSLPDGTRVFFCSCHRCEAKWWDRDGEHLPLDAVMDLRADT
jgi:DNA-directed RNA polymerase subunit M/transcription elongation factor TFIIS